MALGCLRAACGVAAFAWSLAGVRSLAAQPMYRSHGPAVIVGTIRDSLSGRPVLRADVCSEIDTHDNRGARLCVRVDSTGYFELTGLPPASNAFTISCPGERGQLSRRVLYQETLVLADSTRRRRDIRANVAGCDMRPYAIRTGTFVGVYSLAFESEMFVSCDSSVTAWPTFTPAARAQLARVKLRPAPSHTYALTVEGTVRGPAQFGHGGITAYGIDITRVVRARLATTRACGD